MPASIRTRRRGDPTDVTVRPASLADADIIVRFRMELLKEHGRHPIYGRLRDDAEARARRSTPMHLASGREITYIAFEGRTPVGMLRCMEAKGSPLLRPAKYGYITAVFVEPAYRRRGLLKRLLDAAVTWSHARGLAELRLHCTHDNNVGNAAWEKFGFGTVEYLRRREISRGPSA